MKAVLVFLFAVSAWSAADSAAAHYQRAKDLAARQQWDDARKEYLEAVRLEPGNHPARLELARVQVMARQFEPALASVNIVLQAEPENLDAELVRASALIGMGKPGVARLFLLDVLKKHPDAVEARFELGVVCLADRRFEDAEAAFLSVWKAQPENPRGLAGVAETWLARKEPLRAVQVVQAESARAPGRRDLLTLLGNTAARAGQLPAAIDALSRALKGAEEAEQVDILARLAEAQRRAGDMGSALAALEQARGLAPKDARVLTALALILDTTGRKKEAGSAYQAALEADPKNGFLLNNYAYLLAETGGDLKQALELAQRAREILPNHPEVTDTVGWIYLKARMTDAAVNLFHALAIRRPENPLFRYHYAMALEQKGDKAAARKELEAALQRDPSPGDARQMKEMLERLK